MSLAFTLEFDHVRLHVLHLRGRPALLAHEVGAAAGSLAGGQSFVRAIRQEWAEGLHDDDDVAELTGAELDALRAEIPTLGVCGSVLVLFPSGAEKTLRRARLRNALPLLGMLHAQVFAKVGTFPGAATPTGRPDGEEAPPAKTAAKPAPCTTRRQIVVIGLPEEADRFAEYLAIRTFAAAVLRYEEDVAEYLNLERQALETLLGREIELLTPPPQPAAPRHPAHDSN